MPRRYTLLEKGSYFATKWVGTPASLVAHTIFFGVALALMSRFGVEKVLLVLTTVVSLEAIYLSIFIQMSVNRGYKKIKEVHEDVEDVLEDTEELTDEETAG